jgi:hypothetical protein
MSQTGNVHWLMVLMLDLLALACCGGAAGVSRDRIHRIINQRLTFNTGPHVTVVRYVVGLLLRRRDPGFVVSPTGA